MVDVTELMGDNITIDIVKNSINKKCVVLSAGTIQEYESKKKLKLLVEMDMRQMFYIPNKTSLKNLARRLGTNTTAWVGKVISLQVGMINNKDAVIGQQNGIKDL